MLNKIKSKLYGKERAKEIRQLKKDGWVSSVEISRMDRFRKIIPRKMMILCRDSEEFKSLKIDSNGSIKYWYRREDLDKILEILESRI
ncbi:hypothetical protein KAR91_03380 [Candidatus Pacearchaeota archaeon]|nr:hypothetical protein [Candidatus Pacearchaeota archaeon]